MMKPTILSASERYRGGRAVLHVDLELELEDGLQLLELAEPDDHRFDELRASCERHLEQREHEERLATAAAPELSEDERKGEHPLAAVVRRDNEHDPGSTPA